MEFPNSKVFKKCHKILVYLNISVFVLVKGILFKTKQKEYPNFYKASIFIPFTRIYFFKLELTFAIELNITYLKKTN